MDPFKPSGSLAEARKTDRSSPTDCESRTMKTVPRIPSNAPSSKGEPDDAGREVLHGDVRHGDVRHSDVCLDAWTGVDGYGECLQKITENSAQDGSRRTILRVSPDHAPSRSLKNDLTWLYSELSAGRAHYVSAPRAHHHITSADDLSRAWRGLCALRASGTALSSDSGEVYRVQLQEDGDLLVSQRGGGAGTLQVQLEGFRGVYSFKWDVNSGAPPSEMDLTTARKSARTRLSGRIRVDLPTRPLSTEDEGLIACDVSHEGLGLAFDASNYLLYPGQLLRNVTISWKGGKAVICDATVAHVTPRGALGLDRLGLRLHFEQEEALGWEELIDSLLHPASISSIPPATLLSAYERSGYLNMSEKEPADFLALTSAFEVAQDRLSRAPKIGASFAAGDRQHLEAFVHQLQLWPRSWLLYHLCRLKQGRTLGTSDDRVLVELYSRAYAHVQRQEDARWFVTYIQANAGYSRSVHYLGARNLMSLGGICIVRQHVIEVSCDAFDSLGADCPDAVAKEEALIRSKIADSYPTEYVQALGFCDADLGLKALEREWATHSLSRKRRVVTCSRAGEVVAVGIFDAASPGLHLYGLLDCVHILVFTADEGDVSGEILATAARWYSELGRERFTYFRDKRFDPIASRPGYRDLGEADVIVSAASHIPMILEHIFGLAAPSLSPHVKRSSSFPPPLR